MLKCAKSKIALILALLLPGITPPSCSTQASDAAAPLDGRGGGIIAFHSSRDGNFEIYVMNADGSGQQRLTDDPAEDSCPNLSPDASKVVFSSNRAGNLELFVMPTGVPITTGRVISSHTATRLTRTDRYEMHPAWTPDGAHIVYAATPGADDAGDIWIMDVDGNNSAQLTRDLAAELPFPTSDGTAIIFSVRAGGSYDLWRMNLDGTEQRPLAATGNRELYGRSSPDGRQVLFCGGPPDSRLGLYLMNADGSNLQRLVAPMAEAPCWSPSGTKIVYQSQGSNMEIYVVNADGTGAVNLTRNAGNDFWASWSAWPERRGEAAPAK